MEPLQLLDDLTLDQALLYARASLAKEDKYYTIYRNPDCNLFLLTYFNRNECRVIDLHSFQLLTPIQLLNRYLTGNTLSLLSKHKDDPKLTFVRKTPDCPIEKILPLYFKILPTKDMDGTSFAEWFEASEDLHKRLYIGVSQEEFYLLSTITIGKLKKKELNNVLIENPYEIKLTDGSSPFCYHSLIDDPEVHHIHFSISTFNRKKHYLENYSASIVYGRNLNTYIPLHASSFVLYYHPLATATITQYYIDVMSEKELLSTHYLQDNSSQVFLHFIINAKDAGYHESIKQDIINAVYEYHASQWNNEVFLTPIEKEEYKKKTILPLISSSFSNQKGVQLNIPKSPQLFIPILNQLFSLSDLKIELA